MSSGITQENMLSILPSVLSKDVGMNDLAKMISWIVGDTACKGDAPAVFQNINQLDEDLLDILAADLKVDWYDFDADIDTKRKQIIGNWNVRKRLGTTSAVKNALRDVWPDSTIEEWFTYGGSPGLFRVLLSLNPQGTVQFDKAIRMIEIFKPVRAHIDGYPILRVLCRMVIRSEKDSTEYHVPISGTIPQYAYHGDKGSGGLEVSDSSVSVGYGNRRCGTSIDSLF